MRNRICALVFFLTSLSVTAGINAQQPLDAMIDREIDSLVATYETLHAAPELSHREEKTASFLATQLKALGYDVTDRVGKFERPEWQGYGVVAVMRNGVGPTVLVRADMDALPVEEKTELPYASKVRTKDDAGRDVGVMHACGHDIHMAALLGTAKLLTQLKDQWRGTLVLIGQPAEETIDGARAMLKDGLYSRFPKPDFAIALHDGAFAAGTLVYTPAYTMASSTNIDIKIRGVGGHGSRPEATKDPIVLAAQIVLALQTIVSRENSPLDPAVVTVGSFQGGTRYNIIPDEVNLQLTVRAFKEDVRQKLLSSIERIVKGTAIAAGVPAERMPIVKVSETEVTTATYNDPVLTERLAGVLRTALGEQNVSKAAPVMGSEDFGYLSLNQQIPAAYFFIGASDPAMLGQKREAGLPPPSLHSSLFAPVPEPTIRTGVKTLTVAVLELLKK